MSDAIVKEIPEAIQKLGLAAKQTQTGVHLVGLLKSMGHPHLSAWNAADGDDHAKQELAINWTNRLNQDPPDTGFLNRGKLYNELEKAGLHDDFKLFIRSIGFGSLGEYFASDEVDDGERERNCLGWADKIAAGDLDWMAVSEEEKEELSDPEPEPKADRANTKSKPKSKTKSSDAELLDLMAARFGGGLTEKEIRDIVRDELKRAFKL